MGVHRGQGRRAEVTGITDFLDDAALQQFVNSKTQRPVQFGYNQVDLDGKVVGVIHVPIQQRPLFLLKRFGSLEPEKVYLRRGSSTTVADPDEVFEMGMAAGASPIPELEAGFADLKTWNKVGPTLLLENELLHSLADEELPEPPRERGGLYADLALLSGRSNPDFWPQLREYLTLKNMTGRTGFVVTNTSAQTAMGVCLRLTTSCMDEVFVTDRGLVRPRERFSPIDGPSDSLVYGIGESDVTCNKRGGLWHIEITFNKVQAGRTVFTTDELFVGTVDQRTVVLAGEMFGDNLKPVPVELRIESRPTARKMTMADLEAEYQREEDEED